MIILRSEPDTEMLLFPEFGSEEHYPYEKQIDTQSYPIISPDYFPGFFHL
jgi:hypothetical protein